MTDQQGDDLGRARLHVGARRGVLLGATLFGQLSLSACAEWLWSGYAVKHPDLKIMREYAESLPARVDRM